MKIHEKKPLIRIEAIKGSRRASIALEGCALPEAVSFIQGLVIKRGSPLAEGKRTSIVLREYFEKFGASKSVSCFGIEPDDIVKYIKEELS